MHLVGFFDFLVRLQFWTCHSMAFPVDAAFLMSRISAPHLQRMTGKLNALASTESAFELDCVFKTSPLNKHSLSCLADIQAL